MIKINRSLAVLLLAVSISTLVNMGLSQKTYAASKTWSGAVCAKTVNINDADCMWDNPLNWLGGVVPANGDSLTFTHILSDGHFGPTNNMPGLTINSIIFTDFNSDVDKAMFVFSPQTITITNGIYNTFDTKGDLPTFGGGATSDTVLLGGDITVTGVSIGDPVSDINLSGHSLSFVDTGTMPLRQIWSKITGNGVVNFNSDGKYSVDGANTYTGTTNVIKGGVVNGLSTIEMFGSSDINISDVGEVNYTFFSDRIINNKITINSKADKNAINSLSLLGSEGTTISLPNITLNGNARFLNKTHNLLTVDLAGIKSNGYCVWYTGGGDSDIDGPSNGFINGPTMCKEIVSPVTSDPEVPVKTAAPAAPTAPNTAIQKFILANPVIVAALGLTTAAAIFIAARRQLGKK